MLVCTVEVMGTSHLAGAGRDALPRVRRWMSRRFFLLFLRTRFVTFAEGFPWTCEAGSRGSASRPLRFVGSRGSASYQSQRHRLIKSANLLYRLAYNGDVAAHFEPNDVTIICETVHSGFFAEMQSIRPRSGFSPRLLCPTNVYFGQQCEKRSGGPSPRRITSLLFGCFAGRQ